MKIRHRNCWFSIFCVTLFGSTSAFLTPGAKTTKTRASSKTTTRNLRTETSLYMTLPSLEQLSKDPFMKQVQYGGALAKELINKNIDENNKGYLEQAVMAQLSHPEGIRGFMVSYLTAEEDATTTTETPQHEIPSILQKALLQQAAKDPTDLIPLTCMNVIMPIAMTTMHQNAELAASSAKTAKRGIQVLETLLSLPNVTSNLQAILKVANNNDAEESPRADPLLVQYWADFFEKWGYKDAQKRDIAKAMVDLLGEAPGVEI